MSSSVQEKVLPKPLKPERENSTLGSLYPQQKRRQPKKAFPTGLYTKTLVHAGSRQRTPPCIGSKQIRYWLLRWIVHSHRSKRLKPSFSPGIGHRGAAPWAETHQHRRPSAITNRHAIFIEARVVDYEHIGAIMRVRMLIAVVRQLPPHKVTADSVFIHALTHATEFFFDTTVNAGG